MKTVEVIKFRLIQTPCCGTLLCWVNPRLMNYCPECGVGIYMKVKFGECTILNDEEATLHYNGAGAKSLVNK
jgi:hypothetical protein